MKKSYQILKTKNMELYSENIWLYYWLMYGLTFCLALEKNKSVLPTLFKSLFWFYYVIKYLLVQVSKIK